MSNLNIPTPSSTSNTAVPTAVERTRIIDAIVEILDDLQPRRLAAMNAATAQVKSYVAGTALHDKIMAGYITAHIETESDYMLGGVIVEPRINLTEAVEEGRILLRPDQWDSLSLFQRFVPETASGFIVQTIDRLSGGPVPPVDDVVEIEDWHLVHDFNTVFTARVAESIGEEWVKKLRMINPSGKLEHLGAHFLRQLAAAPKHRFWRQGKTVTLESVMAAAFNAHRDELSGIVGTTVMSIRAHVEPGDMFSDSITARLLILASNISLDPDNPSLSASIVWGELVHALRANPASAPTAELIGAAVIAGFPAAAPAVGRYLALLEDHPDLAPETVVSLSDLFDRTAASVPEDTTADADTIRRMKDRNLKSFVNFSLPLGNVPTSVNER